MQLEGESGPPKLPEIESIVWSVRLSDQAPHRVVAIGFVAVAVLLAGGVVWRSWFLGVAGFAMILGATAEYWLGVQYRIGPEGASRRVGPSVTAISWSQVQRKLREGTGWRLSPLSSPSRLDAFRGVHLRPNEEVRERVETAIDAGIAWVKNLKEGEGTNGTVGNRTQ